MIIENKLFKKLASRHKKLLYYIQQLPILENNNELWLFSKIDSDAKKLVLYAANFKCQYPGCNETTNLTIHHLIGREFKKFVGLRRYFGLRHFWANQIVLCIKHHSNIHNIKEGDTKQLCISNNTIQDIKNQFARAELKCQKNG